MFYLVVIAILFIFYTWFSIKMDIVSREENIKKLYKNINRKKVEIYNIITQIKDLINDQQNIESKTIIDALIAQNPSNHFKLDANLVLAQLNKIQYVLPNLNFNTLYNNYYGDIVGLEKEITEIIAEKDNDIKFYNIKFKNPVVNLFGFKEKNMLDFDIYEKS